MRPEGDLLPEIGEERPVVRRDAGAPEGADRQAGRQHRHHAGDMEQALGHDEGEIGERDRQRRLGEPVVARPGNDCRKSAAGQRRRAAPPPMKATDELDRAARRERARARRR